MTHAYRKGWAGEHEIEGIFREYGLDVDRVPNSGGLKWKGDLTGLDGFSVEVKRQERVRVVEWLEQAREQAEPDETPLLIFRPNRKPWTVAIDLHDFLDLLLASGQVRPNSQDDADDDEE